MARKSDWSFWDWLALAGGVWLFSSLFKKTKEASIGVLKDALRNMFPYTDRFNKQVFYNDMLKYSRAEQNEIIKLIVEGRRKSLDSSVYSRFKYGTTLTAELRDTVFGWRIFVYQLSEHDFIMLHVFKKLKRGTDEKEIRIAESRLREYLNS